MPDSILIVDDEPGIAAALMTRLQDAGYQTFGAINGIAALEAVRMHRPQAIVLDIRMPDIDGIEVCRRIKADPQLAETAIVFLSAHADAQAQQAAMAAGGSCILSKPYEPDDILRAVEQGVIDNKNAMAEG